MQKTVAVFECTKAQIYLHQRGRLRSNCRLKTLTRGKICRVKRLSATSSVAPPSDANHPQPALRRAAPSTSPHEPPSTAPVPPPQQPYVDSSLHYQHFQDRQALYDLAQQQNDGQNYSQQYVTQSSPAPAAAPPAAPHPLVSWVWVALAGAVTAFLLACIPVLQAVREALQELTALIATIRDEVPDTAAAVRLPALEISDTVEEIGSLSAEVTGGVRASARAVSAAGEGVQVVGDVVRTEVLPKAQQLGQRAGRAAHGVVTQVAKNNAELGEYSEPVLQSAAAATTTAVRRIRKAAVAAKAARAIGGWINSYYYGRDVKAEEASRGKPGE